MTSPGQLEICLSVPAAVEADERALREAWAEGNEERMEALADKAHPLLLPGFQWPESVRIRQLGMDTANCSVGIVGHPPMELSTLSRFLDGAERRGETALVILELATDSPIVITHPNTGGQIQADPLPDEAELKAVSNIDPLHRDLSDRLLRDREEGSSWFAVSTGQEEAIEPLLVDGLKAPVLAIWIPKGKDQIWYLIPPMRDWKGVVEWLVSRAVPKLLPEVAARVRGLAPTERRLVTRAEAEAEKAIADFDAETVLARKPLVEALDTAKEEASRIRDPLLYEDGEKLVAAVQTVLEGCLLKVEDLDKLFGGGRSSDLLVTHEGRHWLVEVRGKSGPAKEPDVADVVKHRTTWPNLRPEELAGAILIVNYQRQLSTAARNSWPYERREFVQSLDGFGVTVIGSLTLCEWWAKGDRDAIVKSVCGPPRQYGLGERPD